MKALRLVTCFFEVGGALLELYGAWNVKHPGPSLPSKRQDEVHYGFMSASRIHNSDYGRENLESIRHLTLNLIKPLIAHFPKVQLRSGPPIVLCTASAPLLWRLLSRMGQRPEIAEPIVNVRVHVSLKCMLASTSVPSLARLQHEAATS